MSTLTKTIIGLGFAFAAAGMVAAPSFAAEPKKPVKAKVKAKAKPAAKAEPEAVADGPDADITDTPTTLEYNCELGAKITIFRNEGDDSHIALRWKKRIHRLERVGTTTGALRFENLSYGLIWIGIPSKGMLLDSKLNRQLANECKNADQVKPAVLVIPAVLVTPAAAPAVIDTPAATATPEPKKN